MRTNQNLCGMNAADFQKEVDGKKTDLFILKNAKGYEVAITNYGGALVAIMVPDKNGNIVNVTQGYESVTPYETSPVGHAGGTIGPYANKISNGEFSLNNKTYKAYIEI